MKGKWLSSLIGLFPTTLLSISFLNPAQPTLAKDGIIKSPPTWYCLRVGYLSDWLYYQKYRTEFPSPGTHPPSNYTKLSTDAAIVTLDFKNRLDLTTLLGSSQIQIDEDVYTKRQFSWGVGAKWMIYKSQVFCVGLDLKYFESAQKPLFFVGDGYAYNILSDFKLEYTEMQAALGAAYRTKLFSPYIYLSYLYSKINPKPYSVIVQIPTFDLSAETLSNSIINQRRWGMAVGGTLLDGKKATLTVESRFFNQNGLSVSGEVRF